MNYSVKTTVDFPRIVFHEHKKLTKKEVQIQLRSFWNSENFIKPMLRQIKLNRKARK